MKKSPIQLKKIDVFKKALLFFGLLLLISASMFFFSRQYFLKNISRITQPSFTSSGIKDIKNVYWQLSAYRSAEDQLVEEVPEEGLDYPTIFFEDDGRVHGSNGCNNYFGTYQIEDQNVLKFSSFGSTLKLCYQKDGHERFGVLFRQTKRFVIEEQKKLVFQNEQKETLLEFSAAILCLTDSSKNGLVAILIYR